jgi:hypothetical protein
VLGGDLHVVGDEPKDDAAVNDQLRQTDAVRRRRPGDADRR